MCDNCREEINVQQDNLQEVEYEDFIGFTPIELFKEDVEFLGYDADEFQNGIDSVSFICGQLSAFINCGLSPEMALNYIMSKEINENNIKISEISKSMNIEVSKNQVINVDKNTV